MCNSNEYDPVSGFNPELVHKPKNMTQDSVVKVNQMIKNNTFVKIVTFDQKEGKCNYEGQLVGLDSYGNIIIQCYDKTEDSDPKKGPSNQQKPVSSQQKLSNSQQRSPGVQQKNSNVQQKKHPSNVKQLHAKQPKPDPRTTLYVIKLSYISKIIEVPKTENK